MGRSLELYHQGTKQMNLFQEAKIILVKV